jgi:hypothetical protein
VFPVTVSAGLWSTCALLSDGTVRCWGYNEYGQLGNGTHTDSSTPVPVEGLSNAVALSASAGNHACVALADRTVRVSIASHGACPLPDGGALCASNADCTTGLYCQKTTCAATTGLCSGEPSCWPSAWS